MPKISIRGNEMPASPIRKLAPLADDAKKRGVHVYHLNIGQPDLPTPQAALDAIRNIDRAVLEYSPSQGYQSYREKLVGYYKKYDINLNADDIILQEVRHQSECRRYHHHYRWFRSGALRFLELFESGRRNHRAGTGIRQLHGFRYLGRSGHPYRDNDH